MDNPSNPMTALSHALRAIGGDRRGHDDLDTRVRQAAWVARCVGRGRTAPLTTADLSALASTLRTERVTRGNVLFTGGRPTPGVWIVREGRVELSVGANRRHVVIHVLRPGDVDGDIPLLLNMPLPYTARALTEGTCLFLTKTDFEALLATHPGIARRWLSSVAARLATSQARILALLGRSLTEQLTRLLLDEAVDANTDARVPAHIPLPQRTLAAMLGVQRPSLNKILKELERDELIAIHYAGIDILDPDGLARRAG